MFIYALHCPTEKAGFLYIGKTQDIVDRFIQHLHFAVKGKKSKRDSWLRSRLFSDLEFEMTTLQETTEKQASVDEMFWISYFESLGASLLNMTEGGDGISNPSAQIRLAMSIAKLGKKRGPLPPETKMKMSIVKLGPKNPMYGKIPANKKEKIKINCLTCGIQVLHHESKKRKYCGRKCYDISQTKERT